VSRDLVEGWIRLAFVRGFKAGNESPGLDEYIRDRCDEFIAAIPVDVLDQLARDGAHSAARGLR
jgi:hypothetical protein